MNKQKNKNSIRTCSTCGLIVTNTLVVHCPRCNTVLCKVEHTCTACFTQKNCFIQKQSEDTDTKDYSGQ